MRAMMPTTNKAPPTPMPAAAATLSLLLSDDDVVPAAEVAADEVAAVVDIIDVDMTSVKVGIAVSLVRAASVVDTAHSEQRTISGFDLNMMP